MSQYEKLLLSIMSSTKDKSISLRTCAPSLIGLGSKGDHFIYTKNGAYIAEVPELAGCMADGPTAKDALHNVEQIAREWIETARELGREVPAPKGRLRYV